jgi:hypothetical protein
VNVAFHRRTSNIEARVLPNSQSPKDATGGAVIKPACASATETF